MDRQATFNKIATHLFSQGQRSTFPHNGQDLCAYRSGVGSCAVGCLIPDELYSSKMERNAIDLEFVAEHNLESVWGPVNQADINFLRYFQRAHDEQFTWTDGMMKQVLAIGAQVFNLDFSILSTLTMRTQ